MKLAARIKSGPIGPTRFGPQPIRVRAGSARLVRIVFKNFLIINFLKMTYIYIFLLGFFSKSYSDHTNEDVD